MMGYWDAVASAGPDNHTNTSSSIFTGWMLFLMPNRQCQSSEGRHMKAKQPPPYGNVTLCSIQRQKSIKITCKTETNLQVVESDLSLPFLISDEQLYSVFQSTAAPHD